MQEEEQERFVVSNEIFESYGKGKKGGSTTGTPGGSMREEREV